MQSLQEAFSSVVILEGIVGAPADGGSTTDEILMAASQLATFVQAAEGGEREGEKECGEGSVHYDRKRVRLRKQRKDRRARRPVAYKERRTGWRQRKRVRCFPCFEPLKLPCPSRPRAPVHPPITSRIPQSHASVSYIYTPPPFAKHDTAACPPSVRLFVSLHASKTHVVNAVSASSTYAGVDESGDGCSITINVYPVPCCRGRS